MKTTLLYGSWNKNTDSVASFTAPSSGTLTGVDMQVYSPTGNPFSRGYTVAQVGLEPKFQTVVGSDGVIAHIATGVASVGTGAMNHSVSKFVGPICFKVKKGEKIYINSIATEDVTWVLFCTLHWK